MRQLTKEEILQQLMLARALLRARDRLRDDKSHNEAHNRAASMLTGMYVLLGDHADVKLRRIRLATGSRDISKLLEILGTFLPRDASLSDFGKTPWQKVQFAFENANYECPLALMEFHQEYQKELANAAANGPRLSHPAPTLPPGMRHL